MSPDRVAVVHGDETLTYRDLHERATRFAHVLAGLGVTGGDRVAYLGANEPEFLAALFGTGMVGGIFVPLNTRLALPELAYILGDCGAKVLVHTQDADFDVAHTLDRAAFATALAGASVAPVDEPVDQDDVAMIMYTSGTTGRPKGAALSHANLHWNTMNLLIDVDLAGDEVTLVNAPMFHVAALNQTVLPTLLKGGTVVLDSFDPARTLATIARHRVTYLFGVPAMFQTIAATPEWADADLSSVRTLICGGAPVPERVITTYQERGLVFLQGYGLTESSPSALFLRVAESDRVGSAGTPCFFTDVRVIDADGFDVRPGEPGEVILHGPNVMTGYWGKPDATAAVLSPDGWLRTGDVAIADEEGFLYIRDRIKDMIISGGENIYPAEVEDVLLKHPAVGDCAVIGVADQQWGEVGRAIVVARETVSQEEIQTFLNGRIARYKIPKSVVFTDTLPRTASGKLLKSALRKDFGGDA